MRLRVESPQALARDGYQRGCRADQKGAKPSKPSRLLQGAPATGDPSTVTPGSATGLKSAVGAGASGAAARKGKSTGAVFPTIKSAGPRPEKGVGLMARAGHSLQRAGRSMVRGPAKAATAVAEATESAADSVRRGMQAVFGQGKHRRSASGSAAAAPGETRAKPSSDRWFEGCGLLRQHLREVA